MDIFYACINIGKVYLFICYHMIIIIWYFIIYLFILVTQFLLTSCYTLHLIYFLHVNAYACMCADAVHMKSHLDYDNMSTLKGLTFMVLS